jgi:hypothetical protein
MFMAFADPQKVKIGAKESTLPRVSSGNFTSLYQSEDGLVKLSAATTSNGKRKRQVFRLDQNKITTDPFDTTQNVELGASVYLVADRPLAGFTNTEMLEMVTALTELGAASTNTVYKKFLASES